MFKSKRNFCNLSSRQKRRLVVQESRNRLSASNCNNTPVPNYVIENGLDISTSVLTDECHQNVISISDQQNSTLNQKTNVIASDQFITINSSTENMYSNCNSNIGMSSVGSRQQLLSNTTTNYSDIPFSSISNESKSMRYSLKEWAVKHSVAQTVLSDLLVILKQYGHDDLPKEARTLMETPRYAGSSVVEFPGGGSYLHIGMAKGILRVFQQYNNDIIPKVIKININIDGIPLCKSSGSQFWPILCAISNDIPVCGYDYPFIVGVFHGDKKPHDVNIFLNPFVTEYNKLKTEGICIGDKHVIVQINAVICDAPARAFACGTKYHSGYFGCAKCVIEGDFLENGVVYLEQNCGLRTDQSFKEKRQEEHHRQTTILETTGIGMVSQVPLDYMHLVCLGVMKKLLQFWVKGRQNVRLNKNELEKISNLSNKLKPYITTEFARKPRSILEIDRWKATEFRLFLLYTGPILLKDVLSKNRYKHFLSLSIAIRILCDKNYCITLNDYAKKLLVYFVKKFELYYGQKHVSYNIHNLLHLSDDVVHLQSPLDTFSAFKFEDFLYKLKRKLQSSRKPLEQVANRIEEESKLKSNNFLNKTYPIVLFDNNQEIKKIILSEFIISTSGYNNCFLLKNGNVIFVTKIIIETGEICFKSEIICRKSSLFDSPCNSQLLNILIVPISKIKESGECYKIVDIQRKCLYFNLNEIEYVVIPLIHQLT